MRRNSHSPKNRNFQKNLLILPDFSRFFRSASDNDNTSTFRIEPRSAKDGRAALSSRRARFNFSHKRGREFTLSRQGSHKGIVSMRLSFEKPLVIALALVLIAGTVGCQSGFKFHNPFTKTPKATGSTGSRRRPKTTRRANPIPRNPPKIPNRSLRKAATRLAKAPRRKRKSPLATAPLRRKTPRP